MFDGTYPFPADAPRTADFREKPTPVREPDHPLGFKATIGVPWTPPRVPTEAELTMADMMAALPKTPVCR